MKGFCTCFLILGVLLLAAPAWAQQLNVGDPVVATQSGYQVIDHTLGTVKGTLAPPPNTTQTAACANDSTFRTRAAVSTSSDDVVANEVVKYPIGASSPGIFNSIAGQTATTENTFPPLALVFEGDNKFYVGHPDGTIELFDAAGNLIPPTFSVGAANIDDMGNPKFFSLDVRQDGKTLDFTSGGSNIRVFNSGTGSVTATIPVTYQAPITSFSITGTVVTIQAINIFPAGTNTVNISGSFGGYFVSGQVTVFNVTSSAFSFNIPAPGVVGTVGPIFLVPNGTATVATTPLYGIRELSPFDGTGGYVAAIGQDIANISSTGVVNFLYVNGFDLASNNWETLALDPDGTHFWATNLATGNLYKLNISSAGKVAGPFATNASALNGQGGTCVVGGFSAAQPAPIMQTLFLSPAGNSDQFTFTLPGTPSVSLGNGVTGASSQTNQLNENMVFVPNLPPATQVTVNAWFIEIDSSATSPVGTSDPVNGSLPCLVVDSISINEAIVNRCGVVKVEFNPDSGAVFSAVNFSLLTSESSVNPTWVSDESKTETTFVIHGTSVTGGTHHSTVYTVHEQPLSPAAGGEVSCGYQNPVTTSPSSPHGNTLPLKFSTAMSLADCRAGNFLNSSTLVPSVSLVKLDPSGLTGTEVFGSTAGNTSGPFPEYRFSPPSTWIININLSSFTKGCYIATTIDASNQIGSFSYSATTNPGTVLFSNGSNQCKGITLP